MTQDERKNLAGKLLNVEIDWDDDIRGVLTCPGVHLHTHKNGPKDTIIFLDDVPTLWCYHTSCQDMLGNANTILRNNLAVEKGPEDKLKVKAYGRITELARQVNRDKEYIYQQYAWFDLLKEPLHGLKSWEFFLGLWKPEDVIWIGEVFDTGPLKGPGHFRSAVEWGSTLVNFFGNHFTTTATYAPGTVDRTNKRVLTSPYAVIEFDGLGADKGINHFRSAALMNYCRQKWVDPFMAVDSGNKSIHFWVERDKLDDELIFFLRLIGADVKSMRPAQPIRLPGAIREGKIQSILWKKANQS
jgi:hypothetical protein